MKVGDEENLVYLLIDEPTGKAIAIDSGWEIDPIVSAAREEKLDVEYAVATHHHSDHSATLWQLGRIFDAKVVAHRSSPIPHDLDVDDGDALRIGGQEVKVLHTPGHTEDSICLYDGKHLFTGDTLLIGSCGRTDFVGGSPRQMFRSLHSMILKLPPRTVIYPGHDFGEVPSRKLSAEARANPALMAKSYEEFLEVVKSHCPVAGPRTARPGQGKHRTFVV
jgi:glyoxylase-like metal-dependent hydrolase (beta-lactamase superfamily II)